MDSKKLIEQLRWWADNCDRTNYGCQARPFLLDSADVLSTLQAENKRLNKIVCSIPTTPDSGRAVSQYDKEMSMCAYLDDLEAENEKLRAELERVKLENNALWTYIEIIDREYRRYMDRGYIDRLDELKKVWKRGQKED